MQLTHCRTFLAGFFKVQSQIATLLQVHLLSCINLNRGLGKSIFSRLFVTRLSDTTLTQSGSACSWNACTVSASACSVCSACRSPYCRMPGGPAPLLQPASRQSTLLSNAHRCGSRSSCCCCCRCSNFQKMDQSPKTIKYNAWFDMKAVKRKLRCGSLFMFRY